MIARDQIQFILWEVWLWEWIVSKTAHCLWNDRKLCFDLVFKQYYFPEKTYQSTSLTSFIIRIFGCCFILAPGRAGKRTSWIWSKTECVLVKLTLSKAMRYINICYVNLQNYFYYLTHMAMWIPVHKIQSCVPVLQKKCSLRT